MIQAKIYQCQTIVKNTFSHYRPFFFFLIIFRFCFCFFPPLSLFERFPMPGYFRDSWIGQRTRSMREAWIKTEVQTKTQREQTRAIGS